MSFTKKYFSIDLAGLLLLTIICSFPFWWLFSLYVFMFGDGGFDAANQEANKLLRFYIIPSLIVFVIGIAHSFILFLTNNTKKMYYPIAWGFISVIVGSIIVPFLSAILLGVLDIIGINPGESIKNLGWYIPITLIVCISGYFYIPYMRDVLLKNKKSR